MSETSQASFMGTAELAVGREKRNGHLSMVLFAALISASFSLGSLAAPHISSSALNTARFLVALMVMGAVTLAIYRRLPVPHAAPWRFGVLGALMAAYFIAMFVALKITDPVSTGAVFTLIPLMSAGFGYLFLRQTVRPVVIFSLIIAGLGSVWVIFRGDLQALLSLDVGLGEMIFFCGCVCHAAYAPLVKKFNRREPVIQTTYWTTMATFACVLLVGIGTGDIVYTDWVSLPGIVWVVVLYLGVVTSAGTFFLVQYASMRLPASKVLSYGYMIPVFIILYEGLLGHGWASFSVLAGAVLTVMGLVVMARAPDL
ncbi:MAG: DMT family transporter [Pseudomonadota bacterium]